MTEVEKLKAMLAEKDAQLAAMLAAKNKALTIKTSEKGCVSVYGLNGKWPVSLYTDQWETLISFGPTIQKYIKANKTELDRLGQASKLLKQATRLQAVG